MTLSKGFQKILFIELGTFLFALSIGLFILPGKVLSGGVAGMTALLSPFIPIDSDILNIILNIILFTLGAIFLGKEFVKNTIIHTSSYLIFLVIVTRLLPSVDVDPLLASLYGGLLGGIGLGIVFRSGGSTGGTDVIAMLLEKFLHIKLSTAIRIIDSTTVFAGLYVYGFNEVLIGLISVFVMTFALERTLTIYNGVDAKKIEIISDKYDIIAQRVMKEMDRGTTVYDVVGGYTGNHKKVLMVVVSEEQYQTLKKIIDECDPNAFMIMSEVRDVNGEGFTYEPRM